MTVGPRLERVTRICAYTPCGKPFVVTVKEAKECCSQACAQRRRAAQIHEGKPDVVIQTSRLRQVMKDVMIDIEMTTGRTVSEKQLRSLCYAIMVRRVLPHPNGSSVVVPANWRGRVREIAESM